MFRLKIKQHAYTADKIKMISRVLIQNNPFIDNGKGKQEQSLYGQLTDVGAASCRPNLNIDDSYIEYYNPF